MYVVCFVLPTNMSKLTSFEVFAAGRFMNSDCGPTKNKATPSEMIRIAIDLLLQS